MISLLFSESCIQRSALRRSFIMLVFCIPASAYTVKFSGEGTVASEVNGPAFFTIAQKWVSSFTYISHSWEAGEWLAWDDYSHLTFYYLYLATSKRAEEQRSNGAQPCMASITTSSVWNWSQAWPSSTKCWCLTAVKTPCTSLLVLAFWVLKYAQWKKIYPCGFEMFVYLLLRKVFQGRSPLSCVCVSRGKRSRGGGSRTGEKWLKSTFKVLIHLLGEGT